LADQLIGPSLKPVILRLGVGVIAQFGRSTDRPFIGTLTLCG